MNARIHPYHNPKKIEQLTSYSTTNQRNKHSTKHSPHKTIRACCHGKIQWMTAVNQLCGTQWRQRHEPDLRQRLQVVFLSSPSVITKVERIFPKENHRRGCHLITMTTVIVDIRKWQRNAPAFEWRTTPTRKQKMTSPDLLAWLEVWQRTFSSAQGSYTWYMAMCRENRVACASGTVGWRKQR